MKFIGISFVSFTLTAVVVANAYYQKKQFYPSVVYITKSNPSMAVSVYLLNSLNRGQLPNPSNCFDSFKLVVSGHVHSSLYWGLDIGKTDEESVLWPVANYGV